ncbi:MAG: alpha/beta hydrolase [Alphaproteobacteria bacterium]|nr:alpha/beta hydrolase [Alphaproteobacteria bacterium]
MAANEEKSRNSDLIRPLEHLAGKKPPAPEWFEKAIMAPAEEGEVTVKGAKIRYTAWGPKTGRGLLFVHGGRAHRNWWRPFAPFFAQHGRVAALDLSGMGDSDWRDQYSLDLLVDEVFAVIEATGLDQGARPIVVGHSFGGWVTLAAVEREGVRLGGAVVVDSPLGVPDPDEGYTVIRAKKKEHSKHPNSSRIYPTIEEPITRFRFLPNQPAEHLYLVDYIAREGLKQVVSPDGSDGWTWKFDPDKGKNFSIQFERDLLRAARCPLAFIYGENSMFATGDGLTHLRDQAKGRSPFIMMPSAYHHLMMDQPIAFVSALRSLLSCWPVRFGV